MSLGGEQKKPPPIKGEFELRSEKAKVGKTDLESGQNTHRGVVLGKGGLSIGVRIERQVSMAGNLRGSFKDRLVHCAPATTTTTTTTTT